MTTPMNQTEQIKINDQIIAIIIYHEFSKDGIEFFTPGDFSQQLGYMKHKKAIPSRNMYTYYSSEKSNIHRKHYL
jgi:hypothetical protein